MPPYWGHKNYFWGGVGDGGAWGMVWVESIVVCQAKRTIFALKPECNTGNDNQSITLVTTAKRTIFPLKPEHPTGNDNQVKHISTLTRESVTGNHNQVNSTMMPTQLLTKFVIIRKPSGGRTSRKNAPHTGGHVFSPIQTIFELVRDINKTNVLTNFHDDWAKIVTSRPNRENCHYIHIEKNATPTGGHVFSPIWTIFELVSEINSTNVLTNFHDDWKTAPPIGGHVFQPTGTTFELNQDITKTNILTNVYKFLTRHDPIFKLGRDFIGTKLLTKFHEDGTRNVASRVFMSKSHLSNQFAHLRGTNIQVNHVIPPTGTIFEQLSY
ncbi:hypothetical protein DPMN_002037 [Dreissena polymorpha]|uniref:Uncharacterized protein n=1 Tax=Dreissena polymorpha TaxID=45954 RepID=A0A9D4MID2_DREPO|nr:hypothetical protein DPMN_002037 [Dreissena polymorpha]